MKTKKAADVVADEQLEQAETTEQPTLAESKRTMLRTNLGERLTHEGMTLDLDGDSDDGVVRLRITKHRTAMTEFAEELLGETQADDILLEEAARLIARLT
jgi:hypothetical protein